MAERPIIFGTSMVRAILDGTKSQTRRVVTKKTAVEWLGPDMFMPEYVADPENHLSPYGYVGDQLWLRETFYCDDYRYPDAPIDEMSKMLEYRADHQCKNWEAGCPCRDDSGRSSWRPSIHMPRWASRITLDVTAVRIERLQHISEDDACAEGCLPISASPPKGFAARDQFQVLWDSINGKRDSCAWADNPWVWVVGFQRRCA